MPIRELKMKISDRNQDNIEVALTDVGMVALSGWFDGTWVTLEMSREGLAKALEILKSVEEGT